MKHLFLILLVSFCATAYAQHNDINYFAGTWNVSLWKSGNKTAKPDVKATWIMELTTDPVGLEGHVTNEKGFDDTHETMVYYTETEEYSRTITVLDGSSYLLTTKGWEKDKLVWEGTKLVDNKETPTKVTITRKSPDSFTAVYSEQVNDTWHETDHEVVTRAKQ